jgi:hypothetical protein
MCKFDRFDFEQDIMRVWNITDELDTITKGVIEYDWSKDQIANALIGLKQIYEVKFSELFNEFERGVRERKIT